MRSWYVSFAAALLVAAGSSACKLEVSSSDDNGGRSTDEDQRNLGGSPSAASGGSSGQGGAAPSANGAASNAAGATTTNTAGAAGHFEDCGVAEVVPNNARDQAVVLGAQSTFCLDDSSDHDWFYVQTPDDGKAHIIELDFEQAERAHVEATVYAAKDHTEIGHFYFERGARGTAFVTTGPNTRTLFDFSPFGTSVGPIKVRMTERAESDAYEPNNSRSSASEVGVGKEISAQFVVPYTSADESSPMDWYSVELTAGEHVFELIAVAQELTLSFSIEDASGKELTLGYAANRGALFKQSFSVPTAGRYIFAVDSFGWDPPALGSDVTPRFVSEPYKFRID